MHAVPLMFAALRALLSMPLTAASIASNALPLSGESDRRRHRGEQAMWELKYETFPSDVKPGHTWDRPFLENDRGVRLVFGGFGKHIEDARETFTYESGDLSFKFLASRKDPASSSITNQYIVWLGAR
jgi:hypothetical protein